MRGDTWQENLASANAVADVPPNFGQGGFNRGIALDPVPVVDLSKDTFNERRANQAGAGVNYDPDSLCLGSENYEHTRNRGADWQDPTSQWQAACRGEIPQADIPRLFPRVAGLTY